MSPSAELSHPVRARDRSRFATSRGAIWLAAACLVGAILAAYHNGFSAPFVFDDAAAISGNPTIRHLPALGEVLSPPRERGQTVGGRPLVNLSLATNYAFGGTDVRGYHVFNLVVHVLAALALFGIARRTFLQPALRGRFGDAATPLGFAIAVLWAVHPLLTESVTYIIQRAESLMGLFYLLTLYCFIRAASPDAAGFGDLALQDESAETPGRGQRVWLGLAFAACLCGMATKEVMATAPLLVLLYDRTFVARSWRAAWVQRKFFYFALGATWLLLGWLVLGAEHRGGTAGIGMGDSVWTYALTQTRAIALYLRLAFWPRPLVFDYGTEQIERFQDAWPFALAIGLALGAVIVALRRKPMLGFLGAWFFVILAPSSSIVPIPVQPVAEHRMYLPLVAIVALVVTGVYLLCRRGGWLALGGATLGSIVLTAARNEDYRDPPSIWADTVAKRPANARAQCFYGDVLAARGELNEALAHYDAAWRLDRASAAKGGRDIRDDILVNSGNVLRALGRDEEAVTRYTEALRIDPGLAAAHFNLGGVYLRTNRIPQAIEQFELTLKMDPDNAAAQDGLGSALLRAGRATEALAHYEAALRLDASAKAHQDLGMALLYIRRLPEAVEHLEQAIRLQPDSAQAHLLLGSALAAEDRKADAALHFRQALEIDPGNATARRALESLSGAPR
ncbi:MAG TPA: tetratricopeptide repeat protein [Opitutaceae bacterium]|nr:tetratricopeptide repeat protein [Opitutaceae bacterium]